MSHYTLCFWSKYGHLQLQKGNIVTKTLKNSSSEWVKFYGFAVLQL